MKETFVLDFQFKCYGKKIWEDLAGFSDEELEYFIEEHYGKPIYSWHYYNGKYDYHTDFYFGDFISAEIVEEALELGKLFLGWKQSKLEAFEEYACENLAGSLLECAHNFEEEYDA